MGFYLLQVDDLEECSNGYSTIESNIIDINNYNDYINQFYKDINILNQDTDIFITDPQLVEDKLEIIIHKNNNKDSSPTRYTFKLK